MSAFAHYFMSLWPNSWWNLEHNGITPGLWDAAPAVTPHWVMASVIVAGVSALLRTGGFSMFCIIAHGCITIPYAIKLPGILMESGFEWSTFDLLSLHATWFNLLMLGLHWLNFSRLYDDMPQGPRENETDSG